MNNINNNINEKLKVIQINVQNAMIATSTLSQFMNENSIDIAFIQVPYCIQNKVSLVHQGGCR
jgi:hypothetical protein